MIGGVDIAGRRIVAGFGSRIQFSPDVATEAAGGPLLDSWGQVVGILGGSLNPAARVASAALMGNYRLWSSLHSESAATPITEIPDNPATPAKTLAELDKEGVLSAQLDSVPELQYAGTASDMPKGGQILTPREVSSFSTFDPAIFVYSMWVKKSKASKGEIGVKIYDSLNRLRVTGVPKRISLSDNPERVSLSFSPSSFQAGTYRIDILWNDRAVWRGFIKIQD